MLCKLLSLDTSTTSTGWCLFNNGEYSESGIINLKNVKNSDERLRKMMFELRDLIGRSTPDIIVIETPVVVRNPQAQRLLTMIFGMVFCECIFKNIQFYELRPTEWRKLVDHGKKPKKRDELKVWSRQKVCELFNKEVTDDESDAILIGQAYINLCNGGE